MSLSDVIGRLVPPFAFAGYAVGWPDGREVVVARAAEGLDAEGWFRAASVSKIITGRVFRTAGGRADDPASELLGGNCAIPGRTW